MNDYKIKNIIRSVILEQEENIDKLNEELLDYFQKQIDDMRNSSFHTPDTIANVMKERATHFLLRNEFVEDFGDTEKWGVSKSK